MSAFLLSSATLLEREVVRFLRQRHRIVGALGTPLVFWFLIGSGLGRSFQSAGGSGTYLHYFFPGTVALILLFTAIFSTISIIEDRREGFLQGVLVSPASASAIAFGKILGGTLLASAQGFLFMALAPVLGLRLTAPDVLYLVTLVISLSFALTALGFSIAWRMDSTQGFHAIMNLFLMPLWFLSGALFPATGAPHWLRWIMAVNPLTYGVAGLHDGFFGSTSVVMSSAPSRMLCLGITLVFSVLMFVVAVGIARRRSGQ